MILKLFGCKGYAFNIFVDKLGLPKKYIALLKDHVPKGEGKLDELVYSKLTHLERDKYYLCKIMTDKPIVTFVIYNNTIFLSWAKIPCKSKQRWSLLNCRKSRKKCRDMNMKKIHVSNLLPKLKELTHRPTLTLLNQLFGYDKSYIQPQNDVEDLLNRFKNANIYVYS